VPRITDTPDLDGCDEDAAAVADRFADAPVRLAVVACSYDTGFEDVAGQTREKLAQLERVFPAGGAVEARLLLVDDGGGAFADAARSAAGAADIPVEVHGLTTGGSGAWGAKGLALREGFVRSLAGGADFVAYVNLNLKAHAAQLATGLRRLVDDHLDAAIGSRAAGDGGAQAGAGPLGVLKSRVYARVAHAAFPELALFADTNGPMKIFTPRAARALVRRARIPGAGLDVEWLMILHAHRYAMGRFPLHWRQRAGSRPPWSLTPEMVRDLARVRRAYRAGRLGP
jgi:hypothetical protein